MSSLTPARCRSIRAEKNLTARQVATAAGFRHAAQIEAFESGIVLAERDVDLIETALREAAASAPVKSEGGAFIPGSTA